MNYDYTFYSLIEMLNSSEDKDMGYDVFLLCGGVTIQGRLIGMGEYLTLLNETLLGQESNDRVAGVLSFFGVSTIDELRNFSEEENKRQDEYYKKTDDENSTNSNQPKEPLYSNFHLKRVTIITGNRDVILPFFRGRINQVTGWSFGSIKDHDEDK